MFSKFKRKKNKQEVSDEVYSFSEIGEKYNFRVSTPQGYFPEDVDRVIIDLEQRLESMSNDNLLLRRERDDAVADKRMIDEEYKKLRWDMSVFEVPHTSTQEDISMLNELSNINSSVEPADEEILIDNDAEISDIDTASNSNVNDINDDNDDLVLDIISDTSSDKKLDVSSNDKVETEELDDDLDLII